MSEAEIIGQDDLETRQSRRIAEAERKKALDIGRSKERAHKRVLVAGRAIVVITSAIGLYFAAEAVDGYQKGTAYRTAEVLATYDGNPATDPSAMADLADQSNTDRNLLATLTICMAGVVAVTSRATTDYARYHVPRAGQAVPVS